MTLRRSVVSTIAWLALGGCASAPSVTRDGAAPAVRRIDMEPLRLEVRRHGDTSTIEVVDAASLFDDAGASLAARDLDAAITRYDRLLADFADSRYVAAALYNAGLAHEGKGDWPAAARRYRELAERFSATKDGVDALFRLGGVHAEMRDWAAAEETFARLAERTDLGLADRVETLARLGYARVERGDRDGAERALRLALAEHEKHELDERIESEFFVAMAHYYVAAIVHERFRELPIRLPEEQMAKDLDEKARLLLLAHVGYIDTINVKDPTWATAAGFQLGTLYREFYEALLAAPVPPELDAEARAIYFEQLRQHDKVKMLLEKAMSVYEKTLLMAERVGARNAWVQRAKEEIESVRKILRGAPEAPRDEAPPSAPRREDPPPSFVL